MTITPEMTDQEILDVNLGGQVLRDMSAITFLAFLSEKMNGIPTYTADSQELLMSIRSAPMSRVMADEEKVRLLRKLLALNVKI